MARQNKEKYFCETPPYRNRNPLNIRWNAKIHWQGQIGRDENGFCRFSGFSMGYRAAMMILRSYSRQDIKRLGTITEHWAIPSTTVIDLRNRELNIQLLLAMTRKEMHANAAQMHSMRPYAEIGYDLAATDINFFK